jgi:hypothetical protein
MTVKVVLYKIVRDLVSTVTLRIKALRKKPTRPRRRGSISSRTDMSVFVTSIDALGYFQAGQEPTLLAD